MAIWGAGMSGTRRRFSKDAAVFGAGLFGLRVDGASVHFRLHSVFPITNPLFEIRSFDLERKKA
jgi:hypothetical protein